MDTKPTIETLLERLAEFRESIETRLSSIESHFNPVDTRLIRLGLEMSAFRESVEKHFRTIDRKMEILSGENLEAKAARRDIEEKLFSFEEAIAGIVSGGLSTALAPEERDSEKDQK